MVAIRFLFVLLTLNMLSGCLGSKLSSKGVSEEGSTAENNLALAKGIELYETNCLQCHGAVGVSNKRESSLSSINEAILNRPQMAYLSFLTEEDLAFIELALKKRSDQADFEIQIPLPNQSVSSSFIISGICKIGSTVALTGDFDRQSERCTGSFSFLASSNQNGIKSFAVEQIINGEKKSQSRTVVYTLKSNLSDTMASELENQCSVEGESNSKSIISRLTKAQFITSIKSLTPASIWAAFKSEKQFLLQAIPNDSVPDSITTYIRYTRTSEALSLDHILSYSKIAEALGDEMAKTIASVRSFFNASCWSGDTTTEACLNDLVQSNGRRFFSRPLTSTEFTEAKDILVSGGDSFQGAADLLYYFIMSPQFLFKIEIEGVRTGDNIALTQYEIAKKISLLVTNGIPDDYLLDKASENELQTVAQRNSAIDYLILTYPENVKDTYWEFVSEWLGKDEYEEFPLNTKISGMTAGVFDVTSEGGTVREGMRTELRNMFEFYTFENPSSFSDILNSSKSFATEPLLSNIHNVATWNRNPSNLVNYGTDKKKGFLTLSAIIAQGGSTTNPFHMGGLLYKHVLCREFGDAEAPQDLDPGDGGNQLETTREHFSSLTPKGSSCMGCHNQINPLGFSFEEFDFLGRKRNGFEELYDTSGNYIDRLETNTTANVSLSGQSVGVGGALDLIEKIDQSKEAHACFAKQYFRFSQSKKETAKDSCAIKRAYEASKTGTILDVIKSIASDEGFTIRRLED